MDVEAGEDGATFADRIDTALMSLWRDSADPSVFEDLYRHAGARVLAWLRWLGTGDNGTLDPLELLQDTFVNVFRYPGGFRDEGPESFRRWARTIAGNVLRRSALRAGLRRRGQLSLHGLAGCRKEPVDPARGPQLRLLEGEEGQVLARAWLLFLAHYAQAYARLSDRDQLALHQVEIEGLSYAQTGARLGVSPSNMKMIMLRSRRRLLKHLRAALAGPVHARPVAQALAPARTLRLHGSARMLPASA